MTRRKGKKSSRLAGLIFILLIGWLIGRSYFVSRIPVNLAPLSSQIEQNINQTLVKFDFKDSDIISQYRLEKEEGKTSWIEVYREICLPPKVDFDSLRKNIVTGLGSLNIEIIEDRWVEKKKYILAIGKKKRVLQKIVFWQTKKLTVEAPAGEIALIIDDIGGSGKNIDQFLLLDIPITYAILPFESNTKLAAEKIHQRGGEIILHLPLEPKDYPQQNPGKEALFVSMNKAQIVRQLENNLQNVPYLVGINNHMGSRFTEDFAQMMNLLTIVKKKKLLFIDSYTTPRSVTKAVAAKLLMNTLRNDVFLDNQDELNIIIGQLKKLEKLVLTKGQAIAIGHVQRKFTALAIKKMIEPFTKRGIKFVFVSQLAKPKNRI
ncbi:MAG: divergent polysaccharide deacetylase family protein [Elusimicrobiota bacterium]